MKLPQSSAPLQLLLVADNEHDVLALRRVLQKSHVCYEITHCVRAEEALERLRLHVASFDLLVTDYKLSGRSGLELCRELCNGEKPLPVVILTRTGSESLAAAALQVGVDDYIIKDPGQGYLYLLPVVLPEVVRRHHDRLARKRLEDQLRQAQKMQAIGTLAGGIAHDFNNILAILMTYTALVQQGVSQDSTTWSHLQDMHHAIDRAAALVQQILTFSHPTAQERQPVQLHLLVTDALRLLRALLPTTIEIQQSVPKNTGTILGNPTQLYQVMMNLCANAEHAMRDTGGILEVRLTPVEVDEPVVRSHPELRPGPYLRLTVRDTGYGMDAAVRERLFDPYFTTKGIGEGTGVGLSLVHGIVADHAGAIKVESAIGTGTTFALYFPRLDTSLPRHKPEERPIPHGHGCLLFVDDEPQIAQCMHPILEHLGYEVVSCTGSLDALETFRRDPQRFDLVITDQTMPGMTGEVLAQELRRLRPDLPIILCTGFSSAIDAEKARALGIDAFCMKPLSTRALAMAIQQVFAQRSQPEPPGDVRILLIDDDDQLRGVIRELLESVGYEVVSARNGREGIQRYSASPTDLVITDLWMPEQEGLETIRALRRASPAPKIIAMSEGSWSDGLDCLLIAEELGAQRVLHKPFRPRDLLGAIQDVLQDEARPG